MSKIVIALGGNALGNNPKEQLELLKIPAEKIAYLTKQNHTVLVGHGNGPQVGSIYNAFIDAKKANEKTVNIPFPEAGAMSQGYIGYHMLLAINNAFKHHNINKEVVYALTNSIVDKNDPAFKNPTKPIGAFYETLEQAQKANPGSTIIEDSGRGYRKVVPSPKPIDFLGIDIIKENVDKGNIVIFGGGGGIPVVFENNQYIGVDGVIDKDLTCAKIADKIDADLLVILTAVDRVFVNFNKPDQQALISCNIKQMQEYIKQNQFAPGSMLPKVLAAIEFVSKNKNRKALIADLSKIEEALDGKSGTYITFE